MTIIDGKLTLGGLGSQYYEAGSREAEIANAMALTIQAGNSSAVQGADNLTALCQSLEEVVPRVAGQPIAVEISNVFFSEGGLNAEAQGFDTYYKNFTLKKGKPRQVKAFSHDSREILDARNKGVMLLEKDARDLDKISKAYVNRYSPNVRLLALFTGSSLTTKIPTKATNDDMDFCRAFGWLRGEDVSDFIPSIYGITHANHYRARKGSIVDKKDITDIVDLLTKYDGYSGEGIVAVANLRTIEDLGALYKSPTNQDSQIIDGVISPTFLGVTWLEAPQMHPEFILFLDKGKRNDLIKRCVNNDEEQRGLKLIEETINEGFKLESGAQGLKAFIFEEEFIIASRFSGAILDIGRQGDSDGYMKEESITELEKYTKLIEGMYNK